MHKFPYYLGFFISGGFLAFPGAAFDKILSFFQFTPAQFGFALTIQGSCSFLGSFLFSRKLRNKSPENLIAITFLMMGFASLLLYGPFVFEPFNNLINVFFLGQNALLKTLFLFCCYGFLGFSIGANSIVNNASGLGSGNETKNLNILNVYFTLGALVLPAFTNAYYQLPHNSWSLPPVLLSITSFASFLFFVWKKDSIIAVNSTINSTLGNKHSDFNNTSSDSNSTTMQQVLQAKDNKPLSKIAFFCGCLILFCYVGCEINLSNHVGPYLVEHGVTTEKARLASSFLWSGLFAVRLFFCFAVPKLHQLTKCLLLLAVSTAVSSALLLVLASHIPFTLQLAIICWIGASIGSFYSLGLSAMRVFYPLKSHEPLVFQVAMAGTLGSILLPPLHGVVVQSAGEFFATKWVVGSSIALLVAACVALHVQFKKKVSS